MENDTLTDEQLMATVADGDMDGLALLVRRHQGQALALAYRTLGRWDQAEDVVQEAFLRVHKAVPRYRTEAKFTTWLYRIVHNLCLNRLPGLRRELLQTEPLEEVLANPSPSLPEHFEAQEQVAFLHAELDRLPEKYRLVLTLRYLQHLSYDEIAVALDMPMGTVKTHIHRARRLLVERSRQWEDQTARGENDANISLGYAMPGLQQAGG